MGGRLEEDVLNGVGLGKTVLVPRNNGPNGKFRIKVIMWSSQAAHGLFVAIFVGNLLSDSCKNYAVAL